eukprot:675472-Pyramimonas_sp.AAC.2
MIVIVCCPVVRSKGCPAQYSHGRYATKGGGGGGIGSTTSTHSRVPREDSLTRPRGGSPARPNWKRQRYRGGCDSQPGVTVTAWGDSQTTPARKGRRVTVIRVRLIFTINNTLGALAVKQSCDQVQYMYGYTTHTGTSSLYPWKRD